MGAASALGLVPLIAYVPAADAASGATLTVSPATSGATSTTSIAYVSSGSPSGPSQVSVISNANPGGTPIGLPTNTPGTGTSTASTNYTVTLAGANDPVTAVALSGTGGAGTPGDTEAMLTLTTAPASGQSVTVSITGTTNPTETGTASSTNYFTVADQSPTNTNTVTFAAAAPTSSTPSVTAVNPVDYPTAAGTPGTVTGSGFGSGSTVCFVPTGTTPSTTACNGVSVTPTAANITPTAINYTSPALPVPTGASNGVGAYQVVVYNPNPTTNPASVTPSAESAASTINVSAGLDVIPLQGVRVANSQNGTNLPASPIPSGGTVAIPLTAIETAPFDLPATATALDLNVTAVGPSAGGNLQVYSGTTATQTTAQAQQTAVNFQAPQDTSNSVVVPVTAGTGENLYIHDNGASVNAIVDVEGYITSAFGATQTRELDTRAGTTTPGTNAVKLQGPLAANSSYVAMTGLTPNTTYAFNVIAAGPTQPGNIRLYPDTSGTAAGNASTTPVSGTSVVNFIPGDDSGALVMLNSGANGVVDMYIAGSATNVVIDSEGTLATTSHLVTVATPYRQLDTRNGSGMASGGSTAVAIAPSGSGTSFVPANAIGAVTSVSSINPAGQGNLQAAPSGQPLPNTSVLNDFPNQVRQDQSVVALQGGSFNLFSQGSATNSTVDVFGYID